ncbi:hypothetical protein QWI17_16900 [Gilvimarinus sp. SDUM040013]|uniref:Histidine kinase n=1 Tax=Gilvimarinus gilvus TaxID=3058038 RepID=A0ABU4S2T7_9GAMM|nr:sensor histidine kinase [Gilvimarinus sp. SDUM040013]MDO3387523.1 hypothetical protein [Gilvimarinus sp. SDUM040013]MDX6851487.1 hypothetical protein [Gilvimarinus sp. SDUM040013]
MSSMLSPRTLISTGALICLLVALGCIHLATSLPSTNAQFYTEDGGLYWQPNTTGVNQGLPAGKIHAFDTGTVELIADPVWLIEEPDVLPDYHSFNLLFAQQSALHHAAIQQNLSIVMTDGSKHTLITQARDWNQLPGMFWLQLLFGIGGAMTGILVWSGRRTDLAARLYALTGIGYLIFAPAAAIYSTRELIINGELFRILSTANHFGALLFTASLTALLSQYPKDLLRYKFCRIIFAVALALWLADLYQLQSPMLFHFGVLGVFATSFVFAFWQWRATRQDPVGRAALRWFLLSVYFATGLFACFIIIPAALQLPQPASQGLMFGAFLLMYWGLALGIVRYRLFDLSHWWHAIMTWFLGGVLVLVLDAVFILSLAMPADLALSLSIAICGWLYFPLRQVIWNLWGKQKTLDTDAWLPEVLPLLLNKNRIDSPTWQTLTKTLWQAASVEALAGSATHASISKDGMCLTLPDFDSDSDLHISLYGAEQGRRLFNKKDITCWKNLLSISKLANDIHLAQDKGREEERVRIRRDIHDDIGARLLTLLHSVDERQQPLIRDTLAATRGLVNTLNAKHTPWREATELWQKEVNARIEAAGKQCLFQNSIQGAFILDARRFTNLTRILREAISNAIKYGENDRIVVTLVQSELIASITVQNACSENPNTCTGNGISIMNERAREIGAELSILQENTMFRVQIKIHTP